MTNPKMTSVLEAEELGDTSTALALLNIDADNPKDVEELELSPAQTQVTVNSLLDELGRLGDLDRARLGSLLRKGQRLAAHVQSKVSQPEFTSWTQDVQHFINEFGL